MSQVYRADNYLRRRNSSHTHEAHFSGTRKRAERWAEKGEVRGAGVVVVAEEEAVASCSIAVKGNEFRTRTIHP